MRFARFSVGKDEYWGLVEGDTVQVITGAPYDDYKVSEAKYALAEVVLLTPVTPGKIIGAGMNYKAVAIAKGVEFPAEPILFLKPGTTLIGSGQNIVVPDKVKTPAFEAELAVVIGKQAKNIAPAAALDYIFGYALANDVTAKDHMPKGQPWTKGKSFDTFTPVGPFLVTGVDPSAVELTLTVNGVVKQQGVTEDMIFDVPALVAFISGIMTLEPGDVILTGTPPGGGEFAHGDVIEIASPQLGSLRNPVA